MRVCPTMSEEARDVDDGARGNVGAVGGQGLAGPWSSVIYLLCAFLARLHPHIHL